ncbi:HRDC domain-containing protein [Microbacterium sp. Marseille-Q6965]|uniref:HRDC domain-containing protein n=1 Tax=Microbacterium sp. Marseille-Q6965 TaxID=2965072 RepID=UPI0021B835D2|nr:HRDC domain-containing protein [Microbacterium sp. Marseille-Q6965]
MTEYRVIDTPEGLAEAADRIAGGDGPVAVDVERASGFRYSQRAYLVQMFRRGAGLFLFDPPAIGDFGALQRAVGDVEWVLHAASQDLPSLAELDLRPPAIFDTELSARLLGWPRVGLAAVTEQAIGVVLKKEHSAADWSTRPLPQAWLEYAALDVEHLIDVRDVLVEALEASGKAEWARQEFEEVRLREPKPTRTDPWRRLSGLHQVRGRRGLAIARELWLSRERLAQEQDIAPGRLVPDRALVAAVLAAPTSKAQLAALKDFTGRASRTQLDRWWAAIDAGRTTSDLPPDRLPGSDTLPPLKSWKDRNPEADARLRSARPAVAALAERIEMPTENLLTPELLRRVSWEPPSPVTAPAVADALRELGARAWQVELTAPVIAEAFVHPVQEAPEAADAAS